MSVDLSEDENIARLYEEEERLQNASQRTYLGMSSIGHPCDRKLWNDFRHVLPPKFKATTLYAFADGHYSEDITAQRLSKVDGIEIIVEDGAGGQIGYSDLHGHFKGHMDGKIKGLVQAPKSWHVWEHKCSAHKKFNKFVNLKAKNDEKSVLQLWDETYYAQAVLYMFYSGFKRHYLTVASAGSRNYKTVRTNENNPVAKRYRDRAKDIIFSDKPLDKISLDENFFQCKWCDYLEVCHGNRAPSANCRTCIYSFPCSDSNNGEWFCQQYSCKIKDEDIHRECDKHLFIPSLIDNFSKLKSVDKENESITYINKNTGKEFINGATLDQYTSEEISRTQKPLLGDDTVNDIKKTFGTRVNA